MTIKEIKDLVREKVSNSDTEWLRGVARIVAGHTPRDGDYIAVHVPIGGSKVYYYSVDDPELADELRRIHDSTEFVKAMWPYKMKEGWNGWDIYEVPESEVLNGGGVDENYYYDVAIVERERAELLGLMVVCEGGRG